MSMIDHRVDVKFINNSQMWLSTMPVLYIFSGELQHSKKFIKSSKSKYKLLNFMFLCHIRFIKSLFSLILTASLPRMFRKQNIVFKWKCVFLKSRQRIILKKTKNSERQRCEISAFFASACEMMTTRLT